MISMKRIKVLHIIKTLSLGGAEMNLLNLIEALDPDCFVSYVAYSAGGELEGRFINAGVKLFKFAEGEHKLKSFATFNIIWRLARFIRLNRIDIVHTHTFNAHIWGGIAAKFSGAKVIEHVHDSRYLERGDLIRRGDTNKQYWAVYYLKNFSDFVVVLTKQNVEFLTRHRLYPPSKVREVHNGIPLQFSRPIDAATVLALRDKFGIPRDAIVILSLVRFGPEKNIDLILRVAPEVVDECPKAIFVIAGNGPLFETVKNEIKIRRLEDRIYLLGFQSDVQGLLILADIFLLPSFLELHSISILEAMSRKIPVVVSRDVGCNNEFITDWENGILLNPFSDEGWAEALVKLLKEPGLRQKIGEKGYETCAGKFNINNVARKIETLYTELSKR